MVKKRLAVLCLVLIMCFSTTTLAATTEGTENIGVTTIMPSNPLGSSGGISTNSTSMPDTSKVYTNGIDNTVTGVAQNSSLYTNKCFYGVTEIGYAITNNSSSKSLTIKLRKYSGVGQALVSTKTIPANSTQYAYFSNLSSNTYYFIEFCAPSDFDGTVQGN